MVWIVAAMLLALMLLARPRTRKFGIAVGGMVLIILIWAMLRSDFGGRWRAPQSAKLPAAVPFPAPAPTLNSIAVQDLHLAGNGAPWRFSGTVTNLSPDYHINAAVFDIERADCYEGAGTPDGCQSVWSGEQTVLLNVPAGQMRNFSVDIWLRGSALRLKGTAKDRFTLLRVTGRRVGPAESPSAP